MTRDRRRSRRRPLAGADLSGPVLEARVLDLSSGGLAVETDRALRVGQLYRFTLRHAGGSTALAGRVLWCRLRRTRRTSSGDVVPVYRAGIERLD